MYNQLTHFLAGIPQYMGEAIIGLITILIAGLIVGYFSSKYFSRISETTRVEGILFEKKIPIYKEIFLRIDNMNQLRTIKREDIEAIIELIKHSGIEVPDKPSYQISEIFTDFNKMHSSFLEIDKYISENRLYYDEETYKQLLIFQNYIIPYVHFYVIYHEAVTDFTKDEELINRGAQMMYTALGIVLSDDFGKQTLSALNCIRNSLNNVSFKRRKVPRYDYSFFNDKSEFILLNLMKSHVFSKSDEIMSLITVFSSQTIIDKIKEKMENDPIIV